MFNWLLEKCREKKCENEAKNRENEANRIWQEKIQRLAELRNYITTSNKGTIIGKKIIKQIRVVFVDRCYNKDNAELKFLEEVLSAGGNAATDVYFRSYQEKARNNGRDIVTIWFSIQGNAVLIG